MNEIPDGTDMIGQFFRERKGLAHESATALAEGVVVTLDMIGLPTFFADRTAALLRQNCFIRFPIIRVADGTLAVDSWKKHRVMRADKIGSPRMISSGNDHSY